MSLEKIVSITQQLQKSSHPYRVAQDFVNWFSTNYAPTYLLVTRAHDMGLDYDEELLIQSHSDYQKHDLAWLRDQSRWRNIKQATMTEQRLIIPLIVARHHYGILVIESNADSAYQAIPYAALLAQNLHSNAARLGLSDKTKTQQLESVMLSLQRQTMRLSAAASVSQAIIAPQDVEELSQVVLRLICTEFNYDYAQILTLNETHTQLTCTMACNKEGTIETTLIDRKISMSDVSASRWVIENNESLLLPDAQADARYYHIDPLPEIGSELILILRSAHYTLGVLVIQSRAKNAFTLDDVDVMQSIADQLAIALHNASIFSQLTDRLADMNAMSEVSLIVQGSFDFSGLLERIADAMHRIHPTGDFTLALQDQRHETVDLIAFVQGQARQTSQALTSDLVSQMITLAAPVFWRNPDEKAATAAYFDLSLEDYPQSFIGLPLIANNSILGVLFTHIDEEEAFDENDLQFMLTLANSSAFAIANMRLLEDSQTRLREMQLINHMSHTLSEAFGSEDMWGQLIDDLEALFKDAVLTLAIYDRARDVLELPESLQSTHIVAPPETLGRLIIENNISLDFPDLMYADERLETLGIDPFEFNMAVLRSWLGTPLRSRNDETIGVIALQSDRPHAFNDRDIALLNMVSAQLSLTMDNARLYQSQRERHKIATSLIDMGRVVSASLNIDQVFARIFEQIQHLLHYKRAAILLKSHDNTDNHMTVRAIDGFVTYFIGRDIHIHQQSPLAQVIQSQAPLVLSQVDTVSAWDKQPLMLQEGAVDTWMGVPLIVKSRVIGILTLDTVDANPYSDDDASLVFALARQASIAVENARLHTEAEHNLIALKDRAQRLVTMHTLASYVSSSLSEDDIFDYTTRILIELFKVDYVSITLFNTLNQNVDMIAEYPETYGIGKVMIRKGSQHYQPYKKLVREHKTTIITPDRVEGYAQDGLLPYQTYIVAPLQAQDQPLGSINLGLRAPQHNFDQDNLDTFMAIAAQIAISVRNAELYQNAIEANRLKSEFLANVSHELRTPLNAIIGYTELLLNGTYGEMADRAYDRLQRVYRSGRQLLEIINNILDLSKIEAGSIQLTMSQINLQGLVNSAFKAVESQAHAKNLETQLIIAEDLPPAAVDVQRIEQVLVNIISNAVKFTKHGKIIVRVVKESAANLTQYQRLPAYLLARGHTWIHISVEDTGIGIAEKDQKMIFDVFTQADGSTVRQYDGTGLGLAITQRLIDLHQGYIWVESEIDQGSTFHIILPATDKQYEAGAAQQDARFTVLIVDEDQVTQRILMGYFDEAQYRVLIADSLADLLTIVKTTQVDVIITERILPDLPDTAIHKVLQANPLTENIPLLVCSVLNQQASSATDSIVAQFKKPVTRQALLNVVATLARQSGDTH